jgi:hypothetical protein
MPIILSIIISLHLILLSKLIFFPYPELFIYPYLTKLGFIPYKQIFDQHFPGLMFFPVNLATLGIDTPNEMRLLQLFLVMISQILLFMVSGLLTKNKLFRILPNIMYLIWQPYFEGYVLWIDSLIVPLLLTTFYFSLKYEKTKNKKDLFLSGLFFGFTLLMKQVIAPLILIYLFYLWFKYKKINLYSYFLTGLGLPVTYLLIFVLQNGILKDFFYWTVTFNLTVFAEMGRKYFSLGELVKTLPVFATAILGVVFYFFKYREVKVKSDFSLLAIFYVGSLFFAYARQDYIHLQPALVFALLILSLVLSIVITNYKYLIIILLFSLLFTFTVYKNLIGNKVMFYSDEELKVAQTVSNYVSNGDKMFAFGTLPHIYQMTKTVPSGRTFVFQFPWFILEANTQILSGLIIDPPKVIIRDKSAEVAGINLVSYMGVIGQYVDKYYHTINKIGEVEIMLPN